MRLAPALLHVTSILIHLEEADPKPMLVVSRLPQGALIVMVGRNTASARRPAATI
jgi:hypothetical protein